MAEEYRVVFLPSAMEDVVETVRYVSRELQNPHAADALAEELIEGAESLSTFPYSHPAYVPIRPLKYEYRKLPVKNYLMFYRVDEGNKTVTISRVVYSARNYGELLQ